MPFAARGIQSLVGDPSPRPRWEAPVVGGLVAVGLPALTISSLAVPTHAREVPDWLDDRVAALDEGTPVINETGWDGWSRQETSEDLVWLVAPRRKSLTGASPPPSSSTSTTTTVGTA